MDEQKSENNLEGSSFLGFDSRFLGKCHQKTVKSRILNYVYFCRFQTLSMPTKQSHSKCLRLSFWKPGGHSKLQICHISKSYKCYFFLHMDMFQDEVSVFGSKIATLRGKTDTSV